MTESSPSNAVQCPIQNTSFFVGCGLLLSTGYKQYILRGELDMTLD